jgi:hypothetical protein
MKPAVIVAAIALLTLSGCSTMQTYPGLGDWDEKVLNRPGFPRDLVT